MTNRDGGGDGNGSQPKKRRGRTAQELLDKARELRAQAREKKRAERAEVARVKRRDDAQRKLLAGTFLLDYIDAARQSDEEKVRGVGRWLEHRLHLFLTRDRDRRVFGLDPREDLSPDERGLGSKRRKDIDRDS